LLLLLLLLLLGISRGRFSIKNLIDENRKGSTD
jgi:hypothetical protein